MHAPSSVINLIRKLRRLANQSPVKAEAESAKAEFDRLMAKYGLTLDDVDDETVYEAAEVPVDWFTDTLAKDIATLRQVVQVRNRRGDRFGFKGLPSNAKQATFNLESVYTFARQLDGLPRFPIPLPGEGAEAWKQCFRFGFASGFHGAIDKARLERERIMQEAVDAMTSEKVPDMPAQVSADFVMPKTVNQDVSVEALVEGLPVEVRRALERFYEAAARTFQAHNIEWLQKRAVADGWDAAEQAVKELDLISTRKSLKAGEQK